jgi:hypothetical protein
MLKLLAAAALGVAFAAFVSSAHAHDFGSDITCNVLDIRGNKLTYSFAENTENLNGSLGGTVVETAFMRNGTMVASMPGMRPIWMWEKDQFGNIDIVQRSDSRWRINTVGTTAILMHDDNVVGHGICRFPAYGSTAGTVGDMGQD